jgi:hypothetical protein
MGNAIVGVVSTGAPVPAAPVVPAAAESPAAPVVPAAAESPAAPVVPAAAESPAAPVVPAAAESPAAPVEVPVPAAPVVPAVPVTVGFLRGDSGAHDTPAMTDPATAQTISLRRYVPSMVFPFLRQPSFEFSQRDQLGGPCKWPEDIDEPAYCKASIFIS